MTTRPTKGITKALQQSVYGGIRESDELPALRRYTQQEINQRITRHLEAAASSAGLRVSEAWSDWLCLTEATLRMIPVHAQSIHDSGTLSPDPPDIAQEWERIKARYGHDGFSSLQQAFCQLLHCTQPIAGIEPEIRDVLGPLYMVIGNPSISAGQFFTPWEMCVTIAKTIMADAPALVYQRMERALQHDPMHAMMMGERTGWITPEIGEYVAKHMLPKVMDHYDPVCVHDPCVGSGGMLLAAAAEFPRWMVAMGLVLFYGQDISLDCTRMAQINEILYGLNGWGLRYRVAADTLRQSSIVTPPEPLICTPPASVDIRVGEQTQLFSA